MWIWTDGLWASKEAVKNFVLQLWGFSELIFCTSVRKLALQMISDALTVISGNLWWRCSFEHSGGDLRSQLNTHWHSAVMPNVLSIWIKAKVRTIMCQYSSSVLWETHQLLKGTFCSSYCSSRGITLFIELYEFTYFSLKGYYLNVIFVKQIMTNFRLLIKYRMSQPINLDVESNIRSSVMIKCGFDLKWDNNEAPSEEDSHALAGGCCWMYGLWLAGCCQRSARQMRAGLMLGFVP